MSQTFRCPLGHRWQSVSDDATVADAHCPSCGGPGVVEPVPEENADRTGAEPASAAAGSLSLPGYTLLQQIGRGGFGVVYLARQALTDRLVAVKLLHSEAAGPAEIERFQREAQVLARLDHPHVVRVLDGGRTEDRRLFLVMEFVDGGGLNERLKKEPQPPHDAAALVETLARAAHYLHGQGVIHRDLKPSNVLLQADGTPRLTDFGLVKDQGAGHSLTETGGVLGTPSYMAPEQAGGAGKQVGPAADVYALGVILYEALTGRPPFLGATAVDTLRLVLTEEPVPPRRLQPTVPRDLETVCLRCLEKWPLRRYPSAEALAEDLRRCRAGEPTAARPVGRLERLLRWCRRHPATAALLAMAALALFGLIGYLWQAARAAEARAAGATAERQAQEARAQALGEALRGHGAAAEALVLRTRYAAGRPDQRDEVLRALGQFGKLRDEAEQAAAGLRDLSPAAGLLAGNDRTRWEGWADRARTEATRWLTGTRLQRGRAVTLPERPAEKPDRSDLPAVALRPDGQGFALVYPGATEVLLLDADGKVRGRLEIPEDFARKARTRETIVRNTLRYKQVVANTHVAAFRFAFTRPQRLEYQVGRDLLTWNLARGKRPRREELPPHRLPKMLYGAWNASSERFLAMASPAGAVTVRAWAPGARPAVVWQPDPGEDFVRLAFGGDGRALFILSRTRLTMIDAASGARADVPLQDAEQLSLSEFIPCPGGVALVERRGTRDRVEPPRLVFWTAALPDVHVQALRHDEPPRCVSLDGAGPRRLAVTGTPDHLVQAWRGLAPLWEAGLPYLGQRAGRPSPRLRAAAAGIPMQSTGFSRSLRDTTGSGGPNVRQQVREQYLTPLQPYRWWGFVPGGTLVVERQVQGADGRGQVRTELHATDGKPPAAYPTEGEGRILGTSEDRRLAVVVADEKETLATLEVWSVAERRPLGRLGRYARSQEGALHVAFLTTPSRKDYLLLTRPYPAAAGAELEVWRVAGAVELVGRQALPGAYTSAFLTPDETRALVWRPRSVGKAPYFARVIDLSGAARVCDLEGFAVTGNLDVTLLSATHLVYASRQGLSEDANDPFRVSCWDLRTGRRTALDAEPWRAADLPEMELSPDGTRLAFCGRLHETGAGHARLYDLENGKLLWQSRRFPWPARLRLQAVFDRYCLVTVDDFPTKGKGTTLGVRWADGQPVARPDSETARALAVQRDALGNYGWFLWAEAGGLTLQNGLGGKKRVRLEDVAGRFDSVLLPGPAGGPLVLRLAGRDGLWDADSGRAVGQFPEGSECLGFDAARRWALTMSPVTRAIGVWDARTGQEVRRCVPRGADFDLTQTPWQLSPDGKGLAVLWKGLLQVWDLDAGSRVLVVPTAGHGAAVDCVAQHAGAGLVASAGAAGVILLWQRDSGRLVRPILAHGAAVTALAFRPDGKRLASASAAGDVALHDLEGNTLWSVRLTSAVPLGCLAFDPSGGSLLAGTQDGHLITVDAQRGRQAARRATGLGAVRALRSAPGKDLVAVGGDTGVQLWDAAKRERLKSWATAAPVMALAFVGGGRLLAVAGKAVEFWDSEAERPLVWTLEVPHGPVRALSLNEPTGELAVADQGPELLVYDLPDLHKRLDGLRLGVAAFPAAQWKPPAALITPKAPNAAAWTRLAEELFERRQWAPLVWVCCTALAERPDAARLWYLRGEAETQLGSNLGEALAAYSRALELKADDGPIWLRRAQVQERLRRLDAADHDYAKALALGATGWEAYYGRGVVLDDLGKTGAALEHLTWAVEANPDHELSWRRLGLICADLGRWAEADKALARAADLSPHDFTLHRWRALALLGGGDRAGFRSACRRTLKRFGEADDADTAARVAWTCLLVPGSEEEVGQCLRLAERAVARQPGESRFVNALGAALYRVGRYEEATQRLAEGLRLDPQGGLIHARLLLAMAQARLGRGDEARRLLAQGVELIERGERAGALPWSARVEVGLLRSEAATVVKGAGP